MWGVSRPRSFREGIEDGVGRMARVARRTCDLTSSTRFGGKGTRIFPEMDFLVFVVMGIFACSSWYRLGRKGIS